MCPSRYKYPIDPKLTGPPPPSPGNQQVLTASSAAAGAIDRGHGRYCSPVSGQKTAQISVSERVGMIYGIARASCTGPHRTHRLVPGYSRPVTEHTGRCLTRRFDDSGCPQREPSDAHCTPHFHRTAATRLFSLSTDRGVPDPLPCRADSTRDEWRAGPTLRGGICEVSSPLPRSLRA